MCFIYMYIVYETNVDESTTKMCVCVCVCVCVHLGGSAAVLHGVHVHEDQWRPAAVKSPNA